MVRFRAAPLTSRYPLRARSIQVFVGLYEVGDCLHHPWRKRQAWIGIGGDVSCCIIRGNGFENMVGVWKPDQISRWCSCL